MEGRLEKIYQGVNRFLNALGVTLFILIFSVVLLQVFMRYVLGSPLVWSEELARYLFIWVSYLGWVYASRGGTHIQISAFFESLPPLIRRWIWIAHQILILVFAVVLGWLGYRMVLKNLDVPTVTLFFTYSVVYLAVPISSLMIVFQTIYDLIHPRKKGEKAT
ncbi:MAG: TRAP transporter small permease [Spirochaetes bacterium]|nr:TRAP transporter small permease [Spirochaetota bacterium]